MALDSEGRQNFRHLMAGRGNLHYAAFEALWVNGRDLRELALTRRKRALNGLVLATTAVVSQVFSIRPRTAGPSPHAAKLASARPTSPSFSRLSARSRSCRTRSRVTPSIPPISSRVCSRPPSSPK